MLESELVQMIKCIVLLDDRPSDTLEIMAFVKTEYDVIKKMKIEFTVADTSIVDFLFTKYQSRWRYCEILFTCNNRDAYARLSNTKEIAERTSVHLFVPDFDLVVFDNCIIRCIVFLKSDPKRPNTFLVTKKDFLETFVKMLYDNYGDDWKYFETYFEDSGQLAYSRIDNDKNRKRRQRLFWNTLKATRFIANRDRWANNQPEKVEVFYVLSFIGENFVKIGHTYDKMETRLYTYLIPSSMNDLRKYQSCVIDFHKSFVLKTDNSQNEASFEKDIKQKFKRYRIGEEMNLGKPTEILYSEALPHLVSDMYNACNVNPLWSFQTLFEFTGFDNGEQMREFNIQSGIIPKATQFFKRGNKPKMLIHPEINITKSV